MTATQQTIDDRPALRIERRLGHSVERVWRAVTAPDELARWFVAEVPWTPEEGDVLGGGLAGDGAWGRHSPLLRRRLPPFRPPSVHIAKW